MVRTAAAALAAFVLAASPAAARPAGWTVVPAPGLKGQCLARLKGPQVNLSLVRTEGGAMQLSVGKRNWNLTAGANAEMTMAIDGAPPVTVNAVALGPVIMAPLEESLSRRLRDARIVEFTVSPGRFRVEVAGLGRAWDDAAACRNVRGG